MGPSNGCIFYTKQDYDSKKHVIFSEMKQTLLSFVVLLQLFTVVSAQTDSGSVYTNLPVKKFYSVRYHIDNTIIGQPVYTINGKAVSKPVYEKYRASWQNMFTCKPCILQHYNAGDSLLKEAVSYGDCGVGWFKEYYLNGKRKRTGTYKENASGDWNKIWERKLCSIPDGQWVYFSETGDTLYSEFWNDGVFIRQVPEQDQPEMWKVDLMLYGKKADTLQLTPQQVKQLVIKPRMKNSTPLAEPLTIKFEIFVPGYRPYEKTFKATTLKELDLLKSLEEAGIPGEKEPAFTLTFSDNAGNWDRIVLDIKRK